MLLRKNIIQTITKNNNFKFITQYFKKMSGLAAVLFSSHALKKYYDAIKEQLQKRKYYELELKKYYETKTKEQWKEIIEQKSNDDEYIDDIRINFIKWIEKAKKNTSVLIDGYPTKEQSNGIFAYCENITNAEIRQMFLSIENNVLYEDLSAEEIAYRLCFEEYVKNNKIEAKKQIEKILLKKTPENFAEHIIRDSFIKDKGDFLFENFDAFKKENKNIIPRASVLKEMFSRKNVHLIFKKKHAAHV